MSANLVNLDALIPREDFVFSVDLPPKPQTLNHLRANELIFGGPLLTVLRKPDFQRETAFWTPEKVRDLIVTFVNEDLVPALILWRSNANQIFVIDGSHRLSCLIAWVNNDYGNGEISKTFFGSTIPDEQVKSAEKTQKLVEEAVGSYKDIQEVFQKPFANPKLVEIAKRLHNCVVVVQSLEGDADKAEKSFFKINEQGVPLSRTELTLLHSRKCPNAVSARAINQHGTGGQFYWKDFDESKRAQIEKTAKRLHSLLFYPPLASSTLKTTDVPIAGREKAAGALSLLFDTVNLTNGLPDTVTPNSRAEAEKTVPQDTDGSTTTTFLAKTKSIVERISSDDSSSLDLHPFVYFYSDGGRHLPSSFLAVVEMIGDFDKSNNFKQFIALREKFEEFLVSQRQLIPQLVRKARGEIKAVHNIKAFFTFCLTEFDKPDANEDSVLAALKLTPEYSFLAPTAYPNTEYGKDFSTEIKSKTFIDYQLEHAIRCDICKARVPNSQISFDHKLDKKYDGIGTPENIRMVHHYCNSAKDQLVPYLAKRWNKTAL
jgi:hypothetical protein